MRITNEHHVVDDNGYLVPLYKGEGYDGNTLDSSLSARGHIEGFLESLEGFPVPLDGPTEYVAPLKLFINGE